MAEEIASDDQAQLCDRLQYLRKIIIHRAIIAWDRSPETFSEEVVALNDLDEALRNHCD